VVSQLQSWPPPDGRPPCRHHDSFTGSALLPGALIGQHLPLYTGSTMPRQERRILAATPPVRPAGTGGPRWRTLLEARWEARLHEVIELSLAYHGAAAAPDGSDGGAGQQEVQTLLGRAVAARRKLADVEEALGRLAVGEFGCCEQCGSAIPAGLLAVIPETRYCPRCDTALPEPLP
jgi:RNA polymerase-binding transcription factor DksA